MLKLDDIRLGDVVRLRNGDTFTVDSRSSWYEDREGRHEGPFLTAVEGYDHYLLSDVTEVVTRNERVCRYCGDGVTSRNPDVDYCRGCHYRGRHQSDVRGEQLAAFRAAFPDADVDVEHTGGGCFWLAFRWDGDDVYYIATDGEACLPEVDGEPIRDGWGIVCRYSGDETSDDYEGTPIREASFDCLTDQEIIDAIRADRAERGV